MNAELEKCRKPSLTFQNRKQPSLEQEQIFKRCLKKGGAKEWGSFERQKYRRQQILKRKAEEAGLSLEQALSYRRGLMKNKNRFRKKNRIRPNQSLGLPQESTIQAKASEFEDEIEAYLKEKKISLCTEADLRLSNREKGLTTTPDFFFEEPLLVCVDGVTRWIRWLEVKWFYGAADKTRFRQKKILDTAKRYEEQRGQGLMLFAFGFAKELQNQLLPHALCVDWSSVADV